MADKPRILLVGSAVEVKQDTARELERARKRYKRLLQKHRLPTEMEKKQYGDQEVRVAEDGTSYMVLPTGQWVKVIK